VSGLLVYKVFIILCPLQHWTGPILPQRQDESWPEERGYHTAYSLLEPDLDPPHPRMVMVGGKSESGEPLGDVWLFDINATQWEEVSEL